MQFHLAELYHFLSSYLGSLLMCAPSSVETSTSTGSGDWLNQEGRDLLTSLFLSAGFLPALRSHTDDPPALSEPLRCLLRRRGLGWTPYTGWTVWGHQSPETTGEGVGASLFFFPFFFFLILYLFFVFVFQNKMEPFALSLLILTVRVWRWACVRESEYACWVR